MKGFEPMWNMLYLSNDAVNNIDGIRIAETKTIHPIISFFLAKQKQPFRSHKYYWLYAKY